MLDHVIEPEDQHVGWLVPSNLRTMEKRLEIR
jgi:hypothetical protein